MDIDFKILNKVDVKYLLIVGFLIGFGISGRI